MRLISYISNWKLLQFTDSVFAVSLEAGHFATRMRYIKAHGMTTFEMGQHTRQKVVQLPDGVHRGTIFYGELNTREED